MISDSHTHNKNADNAIVSVSPEEFSPREGFVYSVGIHPWNTVCGSDLTFEKLRKAALHRQVVAIGETGIDRLKGGDLLEQERVFRMHVELSEELKKPLIIHEVKSADIILRVHKESRHKQVWIRHGFRGNAEMARMYLKHGIYLSFGERFNPEALKSIPDSMLLAETDDSRLSIGKIVEQIASVRNSDIGSVFEIVSENLRNIIS